MEYPVSKKKPVFNEDAVLRGAWRRAFARFPIVKEKLLEGKRYVPKFNADGQRSKKDSVEFHCEMADHWVKASLNGKRNINVDHIVPVVDTENIEGGTRDWNEFYHRLVCDKKNLQRACKQHHDAKTKEERNKRQMLKDAVALSNMEINIQSVVTIEELKALKKQLSKYLTKKKATETIERASKLKQIVVDKITKED